MDNFAKMAVFGLKLSNSGVLEGGSMAQGSRLLLQDRQVVPRIKQQPLPTETAGMFRHDPPIRHHADPVGPGP